MVVLKKKKNALLDLVLDDVLNKNDFKTKNLLIEKQICEINNNLKLLDESSDFNNINNAFLKNAILKNLVINTDNLKFYIDDLLDKIVVRNINNKRYLQVFLFGNEFTTLSLPDTL